MNIKFKNLFLVASWVIYFATKKGLVGGIFLTLSGLYLLLDLVTGKGE